MSRPERQHRRYAHEAAITLRVPDRSISGRTRDVSKGGLSATLSEAIAVGTDIESDIQLVFEDDRQSEALCVRARIVWCTQVDDGYQLGVQFLPMTGEIAAYLGMFLRFLEDDEAAKAAEDAPTSPASIDERFG